MTHYSFDMSTLVVCHVDRGVGLALEHIDCSIPYRTKLFIGINVREIRDCQNRERFKPTKTNFQQALDA